MACDIRVSWGVVPIESNSRLGQVHPAQHPQYLNPHILAAEAASLPTTCTRRGLGEATSSSTLEDQERANEARNFASEHHEALTAHTAGTQAAARTAPVSGQGDPGAAANEDRGSVSKLDSPLLSTTHPTHPTHLDASHLHRVVVIGPTQCALGF